MKFKSDNSAKNYRNYLQYLERFGLNVDYLDNIDIDELTNVLKNNTFPDGSTFSDSMKMHSLAVLKMIDKQHYGNTKKFDQLHLKYNTNRLEIATKKNEDNYVPWEQLIQRVEKMKKGSTEYLINGLYAYAIAPRRGKDYQNLKVVEQLPKGDSIDKNQNYLCLDPQKPQFMFNNYKTDDVYGTQIIDIPLKLYNLLKLYSTKQLENLKDSDYNNHMRKKGLGVNIWRHSYVTMRLKHIPEIAKIANDMGTSIQMLVGIYKID